MLGRRTRHWLGLGLLAVLLVIGTHLVWSRTGSGAGSVATVTYKWLQRRGPTRLNVSVDLYAPPQASKRGPLVVLLQGNDPSQPDDRLAFAANVGDYLQRNGVATASVSFNIHEGYTLRACAADVAQVVHEASGARDPTRLILVGRGLGAWMASMLALDRRLLEGAGMDPKRVNGVIALRGTYDLDEAALEGHPEAAFFAKSVEDRRESSPITYARPDSPPFLMLFGGDEYVLAPGGPDYAVHARHGFSQLAVVTALTLAVVATLVLVARRTTAVERGLIRLLGGLLCALTLVIVASACQRLAVYAGAYGLTVPRLLALAGEVWLGLVIVLLLVAGVRLRAAWMPRATVAAGVLVLFTLVAINPDALIARTLLARQDGPYPVDYRYLTGLSADAIPEIARATGACGSPTLRAADDPWYAFNLSRHRAWAEFGTDCPSRG